MADKITSQQRSAIMAKVKSKNTSPEIQVRKMLYSKGYRYRICYKDLPGKPDIVFKKYKLVIFINGCFWHGHTKCKYAKRPSSNTEYWNKKIDGNISRDKLVRKANIMLGYKVLVVWECQLKKPLKIYNKILSILENQKRTIQA